MGRTIGVAAVLWITAALAAFAEPAVEASAESVGWLAGCWSYLGSESGSGEQWTAPAGGTLLGVSRTVHDGVTVAHEFLILRESEGGGLELAAHPSGQEANVFRLVTIEEKRLVFADPEHDFPQRVIYHLRPDGVLAGRIEGTVDGEERGVDFPMERTDCP